MCFACDACAMHHHARCSSPPRVLGLLSCRDSVSASIYIQSVHDASDPSYSARASLAILNDIAVKTDMFGYLRGNLAVCFFRAVVMRFVLA